MIALIDNFDSFTWNIYDYLLRSGAECNCYRSTEISIEELEKLPLDGIVLSPGPGRPKDHPLLFKIIEHFQNKLPILGICLGHQAIGEYFGATLIKASTPVHGKSSQITHDGHFLFEGLPKKIYVGRYHSLVISNIENTVLKPTSFSDDGQIMSLIHCELPIYGIQFHPESVLTKEGQQIIFNWILSLR